MVQTGALLHSSFSPDGQSLCKLPGCNRPRYVETHGRMHDFCGQSHADEFMRLQSRRTCMRIGCDRPVYVESAPVFDSEGHISINYHPRVYDFCGITCRNEHHREQSSFPVHHGMQLPTCAKPHCMNACYVTGNGHVHPYCSRGCASEHARCNTGDPLDVNVVDLFDGQVMDIMMSEFSPKVVQALVLTDSGAKCCVTNLMNIFVSPLVQTPHRIRFGGQEEATQPLLCGTARIMVRPWKCKTPIPIIIDKMYYCKQIRFTVLSEMWWASRGGE
ncbi:MAG: hypothetical protein VXY70_06025, partial [Actinomycetota bacterium]|nr:hypothetical protein [Actinomycetota bacterium]